MLVPKIDWYALNTGRLNSLFSFFEIKSIESLGHYNFDFEESLVTRKILQLLNVYEWGDAQAK